MFCPRCGNIHINHFPNNRPVADFYCPECMNEYELKSKNGSVGGKINDGAYFTMINRITSNNNPDFFFMGYSKVEMRVNSLTIIPKHFFVPDIIEKRKPLSENAARAGWVGCNILINKIPKQGVINIVKDGIISDVDDVVDKVNKSYRLEVKDIENREWLLDILTCANQMKDSIFTLSLIYEFEDALANRIHATITLNQRYRNM